MSNIKLGATLFCFGTEYAKGEYTFEDCVRAAAECGAQGYEIVGTQMIPAYPYISDEFLGEVQRLKAEYGIGPVGYGANNDRGKRFDRDLTDEEMLADTIIDIKAAHKLGCKVMRSQIMLSPEAFERLAPYAEMFDVRVGIEIHNPETPSTPLVKKYIDVIEKTGSKHLGFVVDFGCFATKPNKPHWDKALRAGAKEEHLQVAAKMRYDKVPLADAQKSLKDMGADPAVFIALQGMYGFVQFTKEPDFEGFKAIIPYSFEMHGKFHYLDENYVEPSIPYIELLNILKDSDFDGYVISEFEDEIGEGGKEFTRRHLEMERRVLGL